MRSPRSVARVRAGDPSALDHFERDGVVWIERVLSPDFCSDATAAVASILGDYGSSGGPVGDLLVDAAGLPRKICYPLAKHEFFFLAIANPALGQVVESIAGRTRELALTWEDIVVKPSGESSGIPPHQDLALQTPTGFVASFGLHLDDGHACPIWFLPGSHALGPLTAVEVRRLASQDAFTPVRPAAGDIVVHDVHCVHYSETNRGSNGRATWYLEFRDSAALRSKGPWPAEWTNARRSVLFHAAKARVHAGLEAWWPVCNGGLQREDWLRHPVARRVPHTGGGVEYDLSSPYYHFGEPS